MKVIFLDVDGVLNSSQDGYSIRLRTDSHLEHLKHIVKETGAKIVLSSSWRIGPAKALKNLHKRLEEYGLVIMDSTPDVGSLCRGDEIRQWLKDNGEHVEKFVILDDEDNMAEYTETNLVQIDSQIGLQEEDSIICIKILNSLGLTT